MWKGFVPGFYRKEILHIMYRSDCHPISGMVAIESEVLVKAISVRSNVGEVQC
jgi:hypothetical protein